MSDSSKAVPTLDMLRVHRETILAVAQAHRAYNVRVFGSVARAEAAANSDIDCLVTFQPDTSIFDQVGLWLDLQDLLGYEVDLLIDHPQAGRVTAAVREAAIPL
jgi:hypothetical protein